jgi:hypothetical protein
LQKQRSIKLPTEEGELYELLGSELLPFASKRWNGYKQAGSTPSEIAEAEVNDHDKHNDNGFAPGGGQH